MEIPVSRIRPNPRQPRSGLNEGELRELADSIREHGVLQPVLLRELPDGGYELVSGERRLRAAELAGLRALPSILVDPDETAGSLTMALVENIQRADLNAIELAKAYRQLQDEFGRTQDEIAKVVGKSRPHVANTLRLLELDNSIQKALADGKISAGHARALLTAPEQAREALYRRIIVEGLSVRQVERLAAKVAKRAAHPGGRTGRAVSRDDPTVKAMILDMERALESALDRKVAIERTVKGRGRIVMEFYDDRDLESLVERLRRK
jgi:ParB family chromosome partitioning protein